MLCLDNVSKTFGDTWAVKAISLTIPAGQMVGIIGRSGAGKSTLLRLINRLLDPTHGRIFCAGIEVSALTGRALRAWRARCAMIFVFSFGLGPLPGVLAIAVHSMGALGKLFAEINDNVDLRPVEGVRAAGANWYQMLRYAVVPQVLPGFLSYTLLRFEINVRAASVIGFVGAGGIGQELMFVIRQFVYTDISAIVLLLIVLVALIDMGCEQLRYRVIGMENVR